MLKEGFPEDENALKTCALVCSHQNDFLEEHFCLSLAYILRAIQALPYILDLGLYIKDHPDLGLYIKGHPDLGLHIKGHLSLGLYIVTLYQIVATHHIIHLERYLYFCSSSILETLSLFFMWTKSTSSPFIENASHFFTSDLLCMHAHAKHLLCTDVCSTPPGMHFIHVMCFSP